MSHRGNIMAIHGIDRKENGIAMKAHDIVMEAHGFAKATRGKPMALSWTIPNNVYPYTIFNPREWYCTHLLTLANFRTHSGCSVGNPASYYIAFLR